MLFVDYLVHVHPELITSEEHAITHNDLLTNNAILRDTKDENDILVIISSSAAANESPGIHVETWIRIIHPFYYSRSFCTPTNGRVLTR